MKITILLRYPKVEKNAWKLQLIEQLLDRGYTVSILFGESSYYRHLKAALKEYGLTAFRQKKTLEAAKPVKLYPHFEQKIAVRKVNDLNSKQAEAIIREFAPDYLLLLGSGIIRKNILSLPKHFAVHCHHGYLPDFRGVSTAEWSVYFTGQVYITTHIVDPGVDTGDILKRKPIPLTREDSIASMRLKCREHSVELILDTFKDLESGDYKTHKQTAEEGKQYFQMHPFFKELVEQQLKSLPE